LHFLSKHPSVFAPCLIDSRRSDQRFWGQRMNHHSVSENEIFVVDDDEDVRESLSVIFSEEGYRVQSFAEGNSFLAAMRSRKPGCVILDVNMPGRSGIDVLKALSAQNYYAPIFVVSGQAEIPLAVDAIKNGALDFIAKPFDIDLVIERVRPGATRP
jgi:FixJ family two-component response regulator